MKSLMIKYIAVMDSISNKTGLFAMYLVFLMIALLLYSSVSKTFFTPSNWTLEIAQFLMMTYFIVGGGYSLKEGAHVRMDLLYERFSERGRAIMDSITILFLICYLGFLLWGGISSVSYAIEYSERSYSAWQPYMWPIKILLNIGIFITLLQAIAIWFKDILKVADTNKANKKSNKKTHKENK